MRNRVAVVTGAGSGIGRASALAFAVKGYSVGLLGHSPDELEATKRAISKPAAKRVF
jgi:NADP-dependent 3-hydroxy acid dehydrogenase YdfG